MVHVSIKIETSSPQLHLNNISIGYFFLKILLVYVHSLVVRTFFFIPLDW